MGKDHRENRETAAAENLQAEETRRHEAAETAERTQGAESADRAEAEGRTADEEQTGRKKEKKRAGKRNGRALQKFLGLMQHVALAVLVIAVCVVAGYSRIRIDMFQSTFTTGLYMYEHDREDRYEDSNMFRNLFGYVLADVVRHGVVSGQLETDGRFDGSKAIDVTAYNYRQTELPAQYVTAEYYLEDLLKWQSYGFETRSETMTAEQAAAFLAPRTRLTFAGSDNITDSEMAEYIYGTAQDDSDGFQADVSGNQLWVYMGDGKEAPGGEGTEETTDATAVATDAIAIADEPLEEIADEPLAGVAYEALGYDGELERNNILVNRYQTTEGKNLEDYVSNWELYYELCNQVKTAANGLAYNYREYLNFNDFYAANKTNMRYMIVQETGAQRQIFTNLTAADADNPAFAYAAELAETGVLRTEAAKNARYIYYDPSDMIYETNTRIDEEIVRQTVQEYDYAYPETTKIWVGVDTAYPVSDGFRQGYDVFSNYSPHLWQSLALALVAGILYLLIWFYLTCVTGRNRDGEGYKCIRLQPFDKAVPTEGALVLACGAVAVGIGVLVMLTEFMGVDPTSLLSLSNALLEWPRLFIGLLAVYVFAADCIAMFFYYSLVRRIKARTLWKNSYLNRLFGYAARFGWKVYDNSDIVLRTWLPYAAFVLFNIALLMFAFAHDSNGFLCLVTLFALLAVDLFVGIVLFRNAKEQQKIVEGIETIAGGQLEHQVDTSGLHGDNLTLANSVNSIGKGIQEAVEISMKDERMKADLITNVSHDIKTPLTSIINYVDLIKREQVDNEKIRSYINVLDEKSQRLKQLTDDLVEASKISSGNISLQFEKIDLTELMNQTLGEFSEKFERRRLTVVMNINVKGAVIEADSRRIWRVIENLFNNIFKYAMEGTRVYLAIDRVPDRAGYIALSVKNISETALNCDPDELTERFIRGDESRTTEGSGLGLSIAKNLTEAQKGTFEIKLDGDLFKVILTFPLAEP